LRESRWTKAGIPFAVFVLALLFRLHDLGQRPFWYDEIITVERAALPWAALIRDSFREHHSPVYFLLVAPFDHSANPQFWVRLPSAIFGALAVMLAYLTASRVAGRGAGIAAALILGLAPTEIAYAQEACSYALEMFCILLALHGLVGLVLARERAALGWRDPAAPLADWVQFIAGSAAVFCTLGDGLPWLLAAGATAAMLIRQASNRAGMLRNFLIANLIALAACLPIYGLMLYRQSGGPSFGFVPRPTLPLIWFEIESIYLMRVADVSSFHLMTVPTPRVLSWFIGVGLLTATAAAMWRLRHAPVLRASLLFALLALPLCLGVISLWQPMMTVRYLLWSGAIFAILAGIGVQAGLERMGRRARIMAILAGGALLLVNLMPFYNVETKPRWDIAARIIAAEAKPGDVFYFFEPIAAPTMRFYLPAKLQCELVIDAFGNLQHAVQAHRHGRQVWVIYGDASQRAGWESLADFRASLGPLGPPRSVQQAGTRITIWRYAGV
jgi:4-amino-4-deoxy-L-arabinose transferase-like glycosyltransferase